VTTVVIFPCVLYGLTLMYETMRSMKMLNCTIRLISGQTGAEVQNIPMAKSRVEVCESQIRILPD
jgi:hypothetical protein